MMQTLSIQRDGAHDFLEKEVCAVVFNVTSLSARYAISSGSEVSTACCFMLPLSFSSASDFKKMMESCFSRAF